MQFDLEIKKNLYTQCIQSGMLSEYQSSVFYTKRGLVFEHLGENISAIQDYDRAILTNPKFYEAYIKRGIVSYAIDNFKRAVLDFEKAMELRPRNRTGYNNLAWVLATSTDPHYRDGERALGLIQTAIQLTLIDDFRMWDTLAAVHAELDQFDKAVDAQSKSIMIAEKMGEEEFLDELKEALHDYEHNRKPQKANARSSFIAE